MASAGPIPEQMLTFIDDHIESIDQLEILRVLGEDPKKTWTADSLARECQIKPPNIAAILSALEKRGLLKTENLASGLVSSFAQKTPELNDTLSQLLKLYRERPVTLIKLIYARANDRLKEFADAFRLRKES